MSGTETPGSGPGVEVEAVGSDGVSEVIPLPHGRHPVEALAAHGWHDPRWQRAIRVAPQRTRLIASATRGTVQPMSADAAQSRDPLLTIAPGEAARPHQRVAAYALVVARGRLLLTQLSARVHMVPGHWNLPGGGIDPGEEPADAVVREVWEETGQRLTVSGLYRVQSQHWLGRAPSGVLEDFHAVRMIYRGTVAEPSEPVLHDIGGSTAAARWVTAEELDALPLVVSVRQLKRPIHRLMDSDDGVSGPSTT